MSDFQVSVGGDFRELMAGFQQLEARAQQAGQTVGKGIGDGIQGFSSRSLAALQAELSRLQSRQTRVDVNSEAFAKAGARIQEVQALIEQVQRKRATIGVDDRSLVALQGRLNDLQNRQTRVSVDSRDFVTLGREIDAVQGELSELERRKLLINANPSTLVALRSQLSGLQGELERVQIGSQRFRELQGAIQATERELARAGEAADGFNLIDGAIQGLAFSLTNTVTNAAGDALRAIGGLVTGFAELDTEIRQAAAAAGEAGGYDKIARAIDTVGIEAAGTQMQVAQLATELIRGGMSVEQMNASLGAIVRGAEATGTGFAQMGSVVSASLKGFGLQAADAKRVVDALVTGANASATSVEGMGMAFKYAAPVARILGVSVEELGIAVGLLTNAGIDAHEAGVTLRNGLSKLASAAPQAGGSMQKLTGQAKIAADTMKQLGINIYNADGTLQPMESTLLKLKGAFDKLDPSSKIRLAINLFGGEDDGTKWLAMLNQSEAEIKKMANTMANTKGATDTARDAMQGFQMAMNTLTGTMDSLGKTIGGVAAGALRPLVEIANDALGRIVALPEPVQALAGSLVLVTGAAIAATAAVVIFQRAMTVTAVQAAGREVVLLAATFGTTLKGAIAATTAVIPGLLTQLSLIGRLGVGTTISALGATLKGAVVAGFAAASAAVTQFVAYLKSASFTSFVAGARSAVVALAPMAAAVAALSGLVIALNHVLGGSEEGARSFADAQKQADEAVAGLTGSIEEATTAVKPWWQRLLEGLPIIGDFGRMLNKAREEMALLGGAEAFTDLQNSYTKVQTGAIAFLNTLRQSKKVTAEQVAETTKYVDSLSKIAGSAESAAQSLRAQAEEAERLGNSDLSKQLRDQADVMDREAKVSRDLSAALTQQTGASNAAAGATREQTQATKEQIAAEEQLNKVIREAPARALDSQIALGQQLVGLASALSDAEQSRFSIVKNGLQYELNALQERGASEQAIAAKRAEIAQADRAALSARYQALVRQQALEQAMLQLTQEKARTEANLEVLEQRVAIKKAEAELAKASTAEEQAAAQAQINLQNEILGVVMQKAGLLAQTQPIEQAIAAATAETARNGLQAQAAAEDFRINADGSLSRVQGIASSLQGVASMTATSADAQDRFRRIAEQSGLAITQAADGSVLLGRTQADVARAAAALNSELGKGKAAVDATGRATGALSQGIASAANPAGALEGSFTKTGKAAPAIVQGSRDFAAFLSGAQGFAKGIAALNLEGRMSRVGTATKGAADEAKRFYDWLQRAAALPGSRWTGGPVEAGGEYRINELGQEAFLSAGRLSLINAPANSVWRAPSAGTVIPAGVTARMQEAGALPVSAGRPAGIADLAVEVGKLREEVGNLARRDWNIHVQQRTGPTASQVMNQIHRLR